MRRYSAAWSAGCSLKSRIPLLPEFLYPKAQNMKEPEILYVVEEESRRSRSIAPSG